ncbi:MAG: MATE family efflux transporter DinF [Gammaproteobacteria bacterium]
MSLETSDESMEPEQYGQHAVWKIALPMIVSSVSAPLLGIVDTGVMGHLDSPVYLAAVAAGATIFSLLFMGMNFLRMGTTGITAQAYGSGDDLAMRDSLAQPLVVAMLIAAILVLLQQPILGLALKLLGPSKEVAATAGQYFSIRIWSAPFALANFVIIGWLLGMQNARGPLAIMLTINLVNIALDLLFVPVLGMKADGVAIATVIAEAAGLTLGLFLVSAKLRDHPGEFSPGRLRIVSQYRELLAINSNLFIRTLALMSTFAFITAQGARMGDVILAANALLLNFQYFLSYALDGIAHAAEALSGKAIGRRNRAALEKVVHITLQASIIFALLFTAIYLMAGRDIIAMLSNIKSVQYEAMVYLPWLTVLPLISVWSFLYDGVFVGATRSREMRNVMVGSALLVFLPVWYLFQGFGNHALWLAFTLFMSARGLGMHYLFRRLLRTDKIFPT